MATSSNRLVSREKVKEAATALIAFHKTKQNDNEVLFGDAYNIQLQLSVWKILAKKSKTHKIKLPHTPHSESFDVCLFAKDEPKMDVDHCQMQYKDKLSSLGVTSVSEVIPLKMLKTEYIPFEARRRLSKSYNLFLADSRIFRLLHSSLGKEFYKRNRYPVTVNLEKKDLKAELDAAVNATYLILTHRGSCSNVTVANTAMSADEVTDNIMAVLSVLSKVVPQGTRNIKSIFVRSEKSVSLPIYTSLVHEEWEPPAEENLGHLIDNSDITKMNRQLNLEAAKEKAETDGDGDDDLQNRKRRKEAGSGAATPGKLAKKSRPERASARKPTPKVGGKKKK